MFITGKYTFITTYTVDEVVQKLEEVQTTTDTRIWKFDGKISREAFTLSPLLSPDDKQRIKPELKGLIASDESGSRIVIQSKFSLMFKVLLFILIVLFPIIVFCLWYFKNPAFNFYRIAMPAFSVIFCYITFADFKSKTKKAIALLEDVLLLKEVKE